MKPIKETIINITLEMVNEYGGGSNITLREIARRLGCAHTSIYNYYSSLDTLLDEAAAESVRRMRDRLVRQSDVPCGETILDYTRRLFDYIAAHKGEYVLLWFEAGLRSGTLSRRGLVRPEKLFVGAIASIMGIDAGERRVQDAASLLQSYFHGEISKFVFGAAQCNKKEIKERIERNTLLILESIQCRKKITKRTPRKSPSDQRA